MKVKKLMIKDLTSVKPSATIQEAVDVIEAARTSCIPVVEGELKLVGMLSERDVLTAALPRSIQRLPSADFLPNLHQLTLGLKRIAEHPVESYMSKDLVTVDADAEDLQAAALMLRHQLRLLPVVDKDGKLIGIIRRVDLFRHVL